MVVGPGVGRVWDDHPRPADADGLHYATATSFGSSTSSLDAITNSGAVSGRAARTAGRDEVRRSRACRRGDLGTASWTLATQSETDRPLLADLGSSLIADWGGVGWGVGGWPSADKAGSDNTPAATRKRVDKGGCL